MTASTDSRARRWPLPPATRKPDGSFRRVGIEFELQGLDVDALAEIVAETLDGTVRRVTDAEYLVTVSEQGDYRVEIDSALLKSNAALTANTDEVPALQQAAAKMVNSIGSLVVPCEVVSPPLPVTGVAEPMEALVARIREAGGQGTQQSPLYAFGVHLNIEPPELEPAAVVNYLKAFVCLYDWLEDAGDVDLTRQLTPFIKPYPADYEDLITDPEYSPDWPALIADYLASNPTRNRAMDMLPMFAFIDEQAVKAVVDDQLIKARPTFHYRLANCSIDDPDWSIEQPWRRWLEVEQLAADRDRLDECCEAFTENRKRPLGRIDNRWREEARRWLTVS